MKENAAYLLDREGSSRWVRGERRMGARIKEAHRCGIRVMTTSMTLIEAYDVRTYMPVWHGRCPVSMSSR